MKRLSTHFRPLSLLILLSLCLCQPVTIYGTVLTGTITDDITGEPLIGATVIIERLHQGTVTDIDGKYTLSTVGGSHDVSARYIGYKESVARSVKAAGDTVWLNFRMTADTETLREVTVTAIARKDSEVSQVQAQKNSTVVQNGVSAQEISRTQVKDASEVIRRIPGISIIDEKFVMVRGLSQRYNNV